MSERKVDGLIVMRKPCDECLFSRRRIVSAKRKAEILAGCARSDAHFHCHKGTSVGQDIVCAGFAASRTSNLLRVAQRLRMVVLVDVPDGTVPS